MNDGLEQLLRLVAEGRLSAEDAAPILAALDATRDAAGESGATTGRASVAAGGPPPVTDRPPDDRVSRDRPPSALRIEVRENDRQVVNLRLPLALGRFAIDRVPGMTSEYSAQVREALRSGVRGPILEVADEDGDGVRIVVE